MVCNFLRISFVAVTFLLFAMNGCGTDVHIYDVGQEEQVLETPSLGGGGGEIRDYCLARCEEELRLCEEDACTIVCGQMQKLLRAMRRLQDDR